MQKIRPYQTTPDYTYHLMEEDDHVRIQIPGSNSPLSYIEVKLQGATVVVRSVPGHLAIQPRFANEVWITMEDL